MTADDPHYTRSNGQRVRVADMVTEHLRSAHAKLAREFPEHPELDAMAAELARRESSQ